MEAEKRYHPPTAKGDDLWRRLGIPSRGARLHEALHRGLPYAVYQRLADAAGLDRKALARITLIAPATLQRRAKGGRFNREESDRLYRFAQLFDAACDLHEGDADAARRWLTAPVVGLGERCPVDMLGTSAEALDVLDLIGRLEHGVTA